jgi:predicted AAA+ superfamily ATPase
VRGIDVQRVLLGVLQPGQQVSIYKDALRRLSDRLHYLNTGDSRFWFDVRPNLRREMEDRKRRFTAKEHFVPEVQNRLRGLIHGTTFAGIHIFTPSEDVPDDWKMHLVILPPTAPFSRGAGPLATKAALEILNSRGDQPRMKRNRLLFLAADADSTARLDDLVCSFKAWESIVKDIDLGDLNFDQLQSRQANKNRESAAEAVNRTSRETYRWLLAPTEEAEGKGISAMRWESFPLNTGSDSFTKEIERVLREHELVIEIWVPVHLDTLLRTWFWKDGVKDIEAKEIWQKTCQYLYMPRLKDSNVFQATLAEGSETRDYFGLALGKRDGKCLSVIIFSAIGQDTFVPIQFKSFRINVFPATTPTVMCDL